MRVTGWKAWSITAGAIAGIAVFLTASAAPPRQALQAPTQQLAFSLDQSQSKVHYTVDSTLHAVHGTFNLKSGILRIDPATGKADGEIIVYAASGDSGNSSRDEKMHKAVLESAKYPEIVFQPTLMDGKPALSGTSDVKLHGVFSLHGGDHDLVVPVHAEITGDAHSDDQVRARQRLVDTRFELGAVDRRGHVECAVGTEPGDNGERATLLRIGDACTAVAAQLIADPIDHQHFAVEAIEGAQAKVTVPQQLPDGDVAVVDAVEQRAHRRGLIHLAAMAMREHRTHPTAQDARGRLGRIKGHCGSPCRVLRCVWG